MPDANLITSSAVDYTGSVRTVISDVARVPTFSEIPIIDIGPFLDPASSMEDKGMVVEKVKNACMNVGFMYFSGHGLGEEITKKVFKSAKLFFDSPETDKMEHYFRNLPGFRGYEPMKGAQHTQGDLKEAWNWGYEPSLDPMNPSSDDAAFLAKHAASARNVWPSSPELQDFKSSIEKYYSRVLVLSRQVIRIFALALSLPEGYFDEAFSVPGVSGRLLHYPPQPSASMGSETAIGIGMHQDIECVTLLLQGEDVQALQVLNKRGEWIVAPPVPGTLVVNVGDMLSRWTNGLFVSTPHRVINLTGQERFSLPCFVGPSFDTVISTLPGCCPIGQKAKFKPITAGEFSIRRMARSRLGIQYDEDVSLEDLQATVKAKRAESKA